MGNSRALSRALSTITMYHSACLILHLPHSNTCRILLELVTDTIQLSVSLLDGVPRVTMNDTQILSASTSSESGVWTHLLITFQIQNNTDETEVVSQDSALLDFYVDGAKADNRSLQLNFPTSITSTSLGNGYEGALQDVGIYLPSLNENTLNPETADFLPQCLCYPEGINSANMALCGTSGLQNR